MATSNTSKDTRVVALQHLQASQDVLERSTAPLNEDERKIALAAAEKLVLSLTKPEEIVMRHSFEAGAHAMSLRVAVDLRLFHLLVGKTRPLSAEELAQAAGAETFLIVRLMRMLTAIGFVDEVASEQYAANPRTKACIEPALEAAIIICHDTCSTVERGMHDYFRTKGYRCPDNVRDGSFQYVFSTEKTYFEYLRDDPRLGKALNTFMTGIRGTRHHWTEWFPLESKLLDGFTNESTFLVDVGGGRGHDLEKLLLRIPSLKGYLVLQDLPAVIADAPPGSEGIEAMAHDFFTPQPIRGARVYYTHFVLHDWPDSDCRKILENLKAAMEPGYSRLLLNESIIPDMNCPSFFAAGDINMMAIVAGLKRTREQWLLLLQSVDLEVVDIWKSPYVGDEEGVIEAVVAS